jgi:hypothetical protein
VLERCPDVAVFFWHYDAILERYIVFDDGSILPSWFPGPCRRMRL